jgi:hypothetical protein
MPQIYAYQKGSGALALPELGIDEEIKELCTIDGTTFVAVSDSVKLPEQDAKIALARVDGATFGKELPALLRKIEAARPETADINAQVVGKIRQQYSIDKEIQLLRTAPSRETEEWNDYVEACLSWGRVEKAKMGLVKDAIAVEMAESGIAGSGNYPAA